MTTIEKETIRLNKLINDLIELNHLQEDMYTIDSQPIAIAQLLVDTIDLFAIHLTEKELRLELNIGEDLIIMGDSKRIQQVFIIQLTMPLSIPALMELLPLCLKRMIMILFNLR